MKNVRFRHILAALALPLLLWAGWLWGISPGSTNDGGHPGAIVDAAATTDGRGYWVASTAGHVVPAGRADFHGDLRAIRLDQPIVGIAGAPDDDGYWMAAADGGVFAFGSAGFHGSMGGRRLAAPVTGIAPTPSGRGYWLSAADGGVFAFGDARFHGSLPGVLPPGVAPNQPVTGIVAAQDGGGYRLVADDGGVFSFGNQPFLGSLAGLASGTAIIDLGPVAGTDDAYWLLGTDGGVASFGAAPAYSKLDPGHQGTPVVLVSHPTQQGFRVIYDDGTSVARGSAPRGTLEPWPEPVAPPPPAPTPGPEPAGGPVVIPPLEPSRFPAGDYTFLYADGDGRPARWLTCDPLTVAIDGSQAPSPAAVADTSTALGMLSSATGFDFVEVGPNAATDPNVDVDVTISWATASQDRALGGSRLGYTDVSIRPQSASGPGLESARIVLKADSGLATGFGVGRTWGDTILHELAHGMGLGHSRGSDQNMYARITSGVARYESGDLAGLSVVGRSEACLGRVSLTTAAPQLNADGAGPAPAHDEPLITVRIYEVDRTHGAPRSF